MRADHYWHRALARSLEAQRSGALVPLATEMVHLPGLEPFVLRRLLSRTPKHLRRDGPKPNPFLPWEPELEVERLSSGHVSLLNKYPVQPGHLLLITQAWQPQAGWLRPDDWAGVAQVSADTSGLWFFNSSPAAGASQPHRHLQLLPRRSSEPSCPLAAALLAQLEDAGESEGPASPAWPWAYCLSRRRDPLGGSDLEDLYLRQTEQLGLGSPLHDPQPLHPYNVLFDDHWMLTVRRSEEHCAGFSLNALAFGGSLLATERSDLTWLQREGPWQLLRSVASPRLS